MDIWKWVGQAQGALKEEPVLVDRLERLPGWVLDGHHGRVDAVVPEMLADVRRLKKPWLEVFIRHWRLQSWVFHRQEITRSLPEAVDLIERAHRADAEGCPQSVCVAQDLCASYGFSDGPGYAEVRQSVANETLDRIDPSWPCFRCIVAEKASALLDGGEPEASLTVMNDALARMRDAGEEVEPGDFAWNRADAMRELGRLDEAIEVVDAAEHGGRGDTYKCEKKLYQALYRALTGRLDEAESFQLPYSEVEHTASLYRVWAEVEFELVRRGARAWSQGLFRVLATSCRRLLDQGCPRHAFEIAGYAAQLATLNGLRCFADAFLGEMARAQKTLHADCGAAAHLEALQAARALLEPIATLPDTFEAFSASLGEEGVSFDRAVAAMAAWPEERAWALQVAEFWRQVGFPGHAREVSDHLLKSFPDDPDVVFAVGKAALDGGDLDGLESLLGGLRPEPGSELGVHQVWLGSFLAERRGDVDGAIHILTTLPEPGPGVLLRHAALCVRQERLEDALASLDEAVQVLEPGPHDWDRMVVARRLERWDVVREGCARVGIEVPEGTGPIHASFGLVRLRVPERERRALWAVRRGPVSAEILSITGPDSRREQLGDVFVFEPVPLDDNEENPLFEAIQCMKEGGYRSFALDGAHPGEAELASLQEQLEALGAVVRSTAGEAYQVTDPVLGSAYPGCYLRVAVPCEANIESQIAATFRAVAESSGAPLVWLELAEALGDDEGLAAMRETAEAWGMV